MTQTTSRPGTAILNPKLAELLDDGEFDWDDPRHRRAYLEYWIRRSFPQGTEGDANGRGLAAGHNPEQGQA